MELQRRKPGRELATDASNLVVKDKDPELRCQTGTELEIVNALRRRSLAFDLVKLVDYDKFYAYCSELVEHLTMAPPPGYAPASVQQILRADRAAFLRMAERLAILKRDARNQSPLEAMLATVLSRPSVSFHLLPLPTKHADAQKHVIPKIQRQIWKSTNLLPQESQRVEGVGQRQRDSQSALPHRVRGCAGLEDVRRQNQASPVDVVSICTPNRLFQPHSLSQHKGETASCAKCAINAAPSGLQDRVKNQPLNPFFCIEFFSGAGRLTACLKALGLSDSIGIDHKLHPRLTCPALPFDFLDASNQALIKQLIASPFCACVRLAPPVERPVGPDYNPPVVRTDRYPNGLPSLTGALCARVEPANKLYEVTCQLIDFCDSLFIPWPCENPGRSFMWDTIHFAELLARLELAAHCQNDHDHEPWCQLPDGSWAAGDETAYPWNLCRSMAHIVM